MANLVELAKTILGQAVATPEFISRTINKTLKPTPDNPTIALRLIKNPPPKKEVPTMGAMATPDIQLTPEQDAQRLKENKAIFEGFISNPYSEKRHSQLIHREMIDAPQDKSKVIQGAIDNLANPDFTDTTIPFPRAKGRDDMFRLRGKETKDGQSSWYVPNGKATSAPTTDKVPAPQFGEGAFTTKAYPNVAFVPSSVDDNAWYQVVPTNQPPKQVSSYDKTQGRRWDQPFYRGKDFRKGGVGDYISQGLASGDITPEQFAKWQEIALTNNQTVPAPLNANIASQRAQQTAQELAATILSKNPLFARQQSSK